jgi:hypothetical protein
MIVVRSLAEAAVYAHLTGHAVVSRRSPRPTAHVWDCMWRDEARQLVFVEQPSAGASTLVDAAGFAQVGAELLASVPSSPQGFVRGEAKRCIADLLLAAYAFGEALRSGAAADAAHLQSALDAANLRRTTWVNALAELPDARSPDSIPVPAHGFSPPEPIARWLGRPLPFPIEEIPDELQVVVRGDDGRFLARHAAHTLAWLSVSPERKVVAIEVLEGRPALLALIQHGFALLEVQKARLRACGQPGDLLAEMLGNGLGEGRDRPILELRHSTERVRFLEIETRDPRFRGALLAVRLDEAERVQGWRLVEGADGYEMMGLLDATAPHLPGPGGERPVVEAANELRAALEAVGEQVRPLLAALVEPARASEVVASLRPRPGDVARAFVGDESEFSMIEARYASLWSADPPRVRAPAREVQLRIFVATAGMLGEPDMSPGWPRHWAAVAPRLVPSRTWVAWQYAPTDGSRGTDYDGLVWLDDHWAWFPAPWRVIGGAR